MLSEFPRPIPAARLATNGPYEVISLTLYRRTQEQSACGLPLRLFADELGDVRIPLVYSHVSSCMQHPTLDLLQALIVADDVVMCENHQHGCKGNSTINVRRYHDFFKEEIIPSSGFSDFFRIDIRKSFVESP